MTRRQRIRFNKVSACYDHHERIMMEQDKKRKDMDLIKQQQEAEPWLFRHEGATELKDSVKEYTDPLDSTFSDESDGRWNWYGAEEDATGMDDELPSAAEDCARVKGNYEL